MKRGSWNRAWIRMPAAALLCLAAWACAGGSGSSGFDGARAAEVAAIDRALDEGTCVVNDGLTICPAHEACCPDATAPTPKPSPPLTPPGPTEIETRLDHTTNLNCSRAPAVDECALSVDFAPRGFPPTTHFYVAVRSSEPGAAWVIQSATPAAPATGRYAAPVSVPLGPMEIQVAVLVFDTEPPALPGQVAELADSGATKAYVTHVLMLSPE